MQVRFLLRAQKKKENNIDKTHFIKYNNGMSNEPFWRKPINPPKKENEAGDIPNTWAVSGMFHMPLKPQNQYKCEYCGSHFEYGKYRCEGCGAPK